MEGISCVSVRVSARGGRGGRFWLPDPCRTLQAAMYSVLAIITVLGSPCSSFLQQAPHFIVCTPFSCVS